MRFLVVGLTVLALATPARADTPDESTATLLALGGTALPLIGIGSISHLPRRAKEPMFLASMAALLVAPSAGHFYAGDYLSTGFKVRIGGGVAFGLGAAMMFGCSRDHDEKTSWDCILGGLGIAAAGAITMGVGAVHDLSTADDAARNASATRGTRMFSFGARF